MKAIEAGARAIDPDAYEPINEARWESLSRLESQAAAQLNAERKAQACIEAAIASGELVPASANNSALADELDGWHDCADGDVSAGNGHFRLQCVSDSDQQRLNLRATLREAAKALRSMVPASAGPFTEEIKTLAHRFWAIHPSSLDDMGLTREQFYAQEMGKLVHKGIASAVAAERERCAKVAEGRIIRPLGIETAKEAAISDCALRIANKIRALSPEPASGEWRDISTAPDDGTEILGYWRGSKTYAIISWSIDGWWKDNADHSAVSPPTHWMPLPEPPAMLTAATKDGSGS